MKRRHFISLAGMNLMGMSSVACLSGATVSGIETDLTENPLKDVKLSDSVDCDVLIIGGGSAGISAALMAGKAGVSTILVEATHQLGGNTTSGGVTRPGPFHAWGKQVIAGPAWDFILECVNLDGGKLPDFTKFDRHRHWELAVSVHAPLYVMVAEDMLQKSGVEIRYHEAPILLQKTPTGWDVITAAMSEIRRIRVRRVIDCTGSASVAALVGAERMRENVVQPGTFNYKIQHDVPLDSLTEAQKKEILDKYDAAMKRGDIQPGDACRGIMQYLGYTRFRIEDFFSYSENNYVYSADNSTAAKRTETNLRGRSAALRMLRFIKTLPGGETARIAYVSPEVGVRETWRVRGDYVISVDDYVTGRVWEDSLCYAYYPIDVHHDKTGVQPKALEEGILPTIPLRSLIPAGLEDMFVAGRCLSADRLANSGLRVQGACMASGQVAAAAATVSIRNSSSVRNVDLPTVKELLKQFGAIVP